jgi:hypothetical protein
MKTLSVAPAARLAFGIPANFLDSIDLEAVSEAVAKVPGLREACLVEVSEDADGSDPVVALVLVVDPEVSRTRALAASANALCAHLPAPEAIALWPLPPSSPFLASIRAAGRALRIPPAAAAAVDAEPESSWRA